MDELVADWGDFTWNVPETSAEHLDAGSNGNKAGQNVIWAGDNVALKVVQSAGKDSWLQIWNTSESKQIAQLCSFDKDSPPNNRFTGLRHIGIPLSQPQFGIPLAIPNAIRDTSQPARARP